MTPDTLLDRRISQMAPLGAVSALLSRRRGGLVLVKDSHRRGVEIVILLRERRPHEDGGGSGRAKLRARYECAITVMEDRGMRTAATTGLMRPAMARAAPAML